MTAGPHAHAIRDGLALRTGSVRLIVARLVALVAFISPGYIVLRNRIARICGHALCGPDPGGPVDLMDVKLIIVKAPESGFALLAAGAVAFIIFDQLLTAVAFRWLDPHRDTDSPRRLRTDIVREGAPHLLAYLRLLVMGLVIMWLWSASVGGVFEPINDRAAVAGATLESRVFSRLIHLALITLGVATIGAFTFWARALTALDERIRVRRTVLLTARLCWRRVLRGPGFSVGLTIAVQFATGAALAGTPPWRSDDAAWFVWPAILAVQMITWHWRIHAAARLGTDPGLADLRRLPDMPWGIVALIRRRFRLAAKA